MSTNMNRFFVDCLRHNDLLRFFICIVALLMAPSFLFAAGSSSVSKETKEFRAYYKSVTGKDVPTSMRYCVFVRDAGCPACRSVVTRKMMSKEFNKQCSFVACAEDASEIREPLARGIGFVDESCSNQLLSFALPVSYCVKLSDGKVTSIIPITMDQLDKLFE